MDGSEEGKEYIPMYNIYVADQICIRANSFTRME
jgi:hypothetical protein